MKESIKAYPVGEPGAEPYGITTGLDDALWIALEVGAIASLNSAQVE